MRPAPLLALAVALLVPASVTGQTAGRPAPGYVRVRIDTTAGPFVIALDTRRAPRTSANFLRYVDDGRLDGTFFYRAVRKASGAGFIQGGIQNDLRRSLDPIPLETTARTGLRHVEGTISMARRTRPDSATGNFTVSTGPNPNLDARGADWLGYAAFGRVVAGMNNVRRIQALPTGGGSGVMRGQMILRPVRLLRARRLDGRPQPTSNPRVWLLFQR
jgi:peptidyl-prolyl cis-trans isomerase A (cyclophilin A)